MAIIRVLCIAFIILLLLAMLPVVFLFIAVCESGKYDYDFVQEKNGSWSIVPVFHPCGEQIEKEFIEEWHRKEKLYKEWRKRNR